MNRQPNIVLCMCDQLRAFEVGCYGSDAVRTPNIDHLAENGVRFEHAVTNDPVCMPARSSLVSGQNARTCIGNLGNVSEYDDQGRPIVAPWPLGVRLHVPQATVAKQFKAAGYDTFLIGKWHIHTAPELLGFDFTLYPRANHRHTGQEFVENGGPPQVAHGFSVEYEIERALDSLAAGRNNPFFLYYSISPPHMPLAGAPSDYLAMYAPQDLPLRPNVCLDGSMAHDEEWFKVYLWDFLYYARKLPHTLELPDGFDLRSLTELYYGLTTWVDDMVGRLVGGLRVNGMLDACGCQVPEHVQGRSLAPILARERERLDEYWGFIETADSDIGVRTPSHLLGLRVSGGDGPAEEKPSLFYDLRDDPYEMRNIAGTGEQAAVAAQLGALLRAWPAETPWREGSSET